MRARPCRIVDGAIEYTDPEDDTHAEATHVTLRLSGPVGYLMLPVILRGSRDEHPGHWTWNGSVDRPTLKPSIKTQGTDTRQIPSHGTKYVCHLLLNDGICHFCDDTTHELRGQSVPLLPIGYE
jgi:hypothetical protein